MLHDSAEGPLLSGYKRVTLSHIFSAPEYRPASRTDISPIVCTWLYNVPDPLPPCATCHPKAASQPCPCVGQDPKLPLFSNMTTSVSQVSAAHTSLPVCRSTGLAIVAHHKGWQRSCTEIVRSQNHSTVPHCSSRQLSHYWNNCTQVAGMFKLALIIPFKGLAGTPPRLGSSSQH